MALCLGPDIGRDMAVAVGDVIVCVPAFFMRAVYLEEASKMRYAHFCAYHWYAQKVRTFWYAHLSLPLLFAVPTTSNNTQRT